MSAEAGLFSISEIFNIAAGSAQEAISTTGAMNPIMNSANQKLNRLLPSAIPQPELCIKLYNRGAIKQETFLLYMESWGINADLAALLLSNTGILPGIRENIIRYRRGLFDKDSIKNDQLFTDAMTAIGVDLGAIGPLIEATEWQPSAGEFITWLVREVFDEKTTAKQGTDQDYPELATEQGAKLGIKEDNLKKIWRAHWKLPGTGDFYEMYQRLNPLQLQYKQNDLKSLGISAESVQFTLDDLKQSLKTADVMPYYRNLLVMNAFKPMARVDIRRLDDLVDIPLDELKYRLREFGYSPDTADFEAVFTKIANKLKDLVPELEATLISYDDFVRELVAVGATPAEAKRQLDRVKAKAAKKRLAKDKDVSESIIKDAYKYGINTKEDTIKALVSMHYTQAEAEFIINVIDKVNELATKKAQQDAQKITSADILSRYKSGTVDRTDTITKLMSIGYDKDEAAYKVQVIDDAKKAAELKKNADQNKPKRPTVKDLSVTDIKDLYKYGAIDRQTAGNALQDAGFDANEAEAKLIIWDAQLAGATKKK